MKLRIRHNSIRLRLGKSEIELLSQGQECSEAIHFPGSVELSYVLSASSDRVIRACFDGTMIRITVPGEKLFTWCRSDEVSLSGEIAVPNKIALSVLIEKDFRCLDVHVAEDQSDTFDNPLEMHPACDG